MKFNFNQNLDFPPELIIDGFKENLAVVKETKLLGIIIRDDLKWNSNTQCLSAKAYKRIWCLRRMKKLDIEPYIILDIYIKEIRSVLELAVAQWPHKKAIFRHLTGSKSDS